MVDPQERIEEREVAEKECEAKLKKKKSNDAELKPKKPKTKKKKKGKREQASKKSSNLGTAACMVSSSSELLGQILRLDPKEIVETIAGTVISWRRKVDESGIGWLSVGDLIEGSQSILLMSTTSRFTSELYFGKEDLGKTFEDLLVPVELLSLAQNATWAQVHNYFASANERQVGLVNGAEATIMSGNKPVIRKE